MTDIPPEILAQLQSPNGQTLSDPRESVDPADVSQELLRAVKRMADLANTAQDSREATEAAKAALAFAQAVVILDPNLAQDGSPLDHHLAMETLRGQNAVALEQERRQTAIEQAKAAPSPARSIRVNRDGSGRATSYETGG